jgi:hypothetical protein
MLSRKGVGLVAAFLFWVKGIPLALMKNQLVGLISGVSASLYLNRAVQDLPIRPD